MKPKPKPKYLESEQGGQRERWLISYTDFVTILLILFIAIAAQGMHSAQRQPAEPPPPPKSRKPTAPQSRNTQARTTHARALGRGGSKAEGRRVWIPIWRSAGW